MTGNIAIVLVVLVVTGTVTGQDYCKVCSKHTMCKYKNEGPACMGKPVSGMDENVKIAIVKGHNSIRRFVALGHKRPAQPPAANMMKLVWDNKLAAVAQRWADQCTASHDECRNDPRFKVGQNIFVGIDDDDTMMNGWKLAVMAWLEEVKDFKAENISPFFRIPGTGHYSQLVWANTKFIGCGFAHFQSTKLYVCNYGPAGNVKKGSMYKKGPACSQCPRGTSCHDGLCG